MLSSFFLYYRNVFISSNVAFDMTLGMDHRRTRGELYHYFREIFPESSDPQEDALHYVMTNEEGKLSRPLMAIQVARAYGAKANPFPHATALELVHRATLVLDDLPSMDNSDSRQGSPSCWAYCARKYGRGTKRETNGVGTALAEMVVPLMTGVHAIRLIDQSDATLSQKQYIREVIRGVSEELIRGQCRDLGIAPKGKKKMTIRQHAKMYVLKTGSLYAASAQVGGRLGNASEKDLERLGIFGRALGLAYQLIDDYRDLYSTEEIEGKPVGLDAANGRPNLASRLGKEKSKRNVGRLRTRAIQELRGCSGADLSDLVGIVEKITQIPS